MPTVELSINRSTYAALKKRAQQHNQSVEELAQIALTDFLAASEQRLVETTPDLVDSVGVQRRAKIHAEAEAWRAIPAAERRQYHNQFVAVHDGQVIDHDADRLLLYRRVREKLGSVPVLITPGDAPHPREFQILSPRLGERR
jgi:hypothetical protein